MKTKSLLVSSYLLQAVRAKEYRLFERGLCLKTKNGYWTSTERYDESDVLDLTEFQFRTYDGSSQCMDSFYEEELPETNSHNGTTAPIIATRDPNNNDEQFLQVLFFKRGGGVTEEEMIGDDTMDALCCSENAIQQGFCNQDDAGKLILNRNLFEGEERLIQVPSSSAAAANETFSFDEVIQIKEAGQYTLLFANCDYGGSNVQLLPDANAGKRGRRISYLGFILFYAFLAVYTASLFITYGRGLATKKRELRHPIQKYLFFTMLIAFDDFAFRACTFRALDAGGNWVWSKLFIYTAVAFPVLKRGMSMCLGILVAKGWGIVDQTSMEGRSMAQIINLGVVYTGLVAFRDFMSVQSFDLMVPLDGDSDFPMFSNVATIVTIIVHTMDILIAIWIVIALNSTIRHLGERGDSMDESDELENYLRLRKLILVSMVVATPWWIIRLLGRVEGTAVFSSQSHTFIVAAIVQLLYVVILTNVSILWRPRPRTETAEKPPRPERPEDESTQQETSTLLFL
mmetsp:Transcript_42765/g.103450  ORF Transcript_42765/g.103450 Transcript_42765/m.103450 type:complete len:514 (+) Transcript_42765:97-1638(+)